MGFYGRRTHSRGYGRAVRSFGGNRRRYTRPRPRTRTFGRRMVRKRTFGGRVRRVPSMRRIRPSQGSRMPLARSLILRTSEIVGAEQQSGANVRDWDPVRVEMDVAGRWIPTEAQCDVLTACRFNHASSKRLNRVHCYLKGVTVAQMVSDTEGTPSVRVDMMTNMDPELTTWHNQYEGDVVDINATRIRKDGIKHKLVRGNKSYISIFDTKCHSRNATSLTIDQLNVFPWQDITRKFDMIGKTASDDVNFPKINADWYWLLDKAMNVSTASENVRFNMRYELVFATFWTLYGMAPN